jgi:uncharacterized RDD family membrane protein YckC
MSFSVDRQAQAIWQGEPPEPYASAEFYEGVIWRRVVAYGVDLFILGIVAVFAWIALGALTVLSFGLLSPLWLLYGLIPVAYHTLLLAGPRSATLGMRLFGIELRSWTGERPLLLQALIQTVLFYLSIAATCSLILLVALFNRRRRTFHDFLAGTMVIRRFPPGVVFAP